MGFNSAFKGLNMYRSKTHISHKSPRQKWSTFFTSNKHFRQSYGSRDN